MIRPKSDITPKIKINIGALLDIPTGILTTGKEGDSIINGGLNLTTGIAGKGNQFKSTILHYMALSAMDKVKSVTDSFLMTYDTEINIEPERLAVLASGFDYIDTATLFDPDEGCWFIVDGSKVPGEEWLMDLKNYLEEKSKDKSIIVETPFKDPFSKKDQFLKMLVPTFTEIDSFTDFETSKTMDVLFKNSIDSKENNILLAQQGLIKYRLLGELPRLASKYNNYTLITGHLDDNTIQMDTNPYSKPKKQMQYLKQNEKVKGVTKRFGFGLHNAWKVSDVITYHNQDTKSPKYPKTPELNKSGDKTELNKVTLDQLRGKSGRSGISLSILVSQDEGVLPTLSEFDYIKSELKDFGISGTKQSYYLDIYPDVKLSRTTVREKIDTDPLLRRAINITAELGQIRQYWRHYYIKDNLMCTPKELYEDIKKLGYNWEDILKTRGWWSINHYEHPIPYLSTYDLLMIRKGKYSPYWK